MPKETYNVSVTQDANGSDISIGSFVVGADGVVYKVNGFSAVPQAGIFAAYGYQVRKATKKEAATWVEKHPKASDGDSIIWGS